MKPIFITATGTNVGKTFVTLKLIEELNSRGIKVGVFKPIETGVVDIPLDASLLLEKCKKYNDNFALLKPEDITAYTFKLPAAPFCADIDKIINIDHIIAKYQELASLCDILIIEGAGGLMTPVTGNIKMVDLISIFDAKALLVTPSRLGCINDTLLSIEALKTRGLEYDWCINLYEELDSFAKVTKPYYDSMLSGWWSVQNGLQIYTETITF
ncbi:MAG: dethiobiotin synthase [Campylobacterales bacterium]|nr:dethiobiotin synthase [Campylobacterales bacterium]